MGGQRQGRSSLIEGLGLRLGFRAWTHEGTLQCIALSILEYRKESLCRKL